MLDFDSMSQKINEISVFFPVYNEGATIESVVKKTRNILKEIAGKWEIIIVNDGSSDNTDEISKRLVEEDKRIRLITHSPNRGYGAALKSGMYNSKYSWIAFTDADGQFDFSEIDKFIKKQKETDADLVIGYYLNRKVSFMRKLNTSLWEFMVFLLFGLKVKDIDCGFKLFKKKVADKMPNLEPERGAFITSEFLIKAKKFGFKIEEVGVHHYPRESGHGTGADLNVIVSSFIDLFKLWKKLKKK